MPGAVASCPGQKLPSGSLSVAVPVLIGVRSTPNGTRATPEGRHSYASPTALMAVQAAPGLLAVASQVPATQLGQGLLPLPVTVTADERGTLPENTPPGVVIVPDAGDAKVLSTQVERPPFEIESGGPKLQPVSEQSLLLPVSAAVRAVMVQEPPAQVAVKNVSAPDGVGPSGTVAAPPPMLRPPQRRLFRTVPPDPPSRLSPQTPPTRPVVKRSGTGPGTVLVVVDVVLVTVVVEVLVGGTLVDVVVTRTVVDVVLGAMLVEVVLGAILVDVVLATIVVEVVVVATVEVVEATVVEVVVGSEVLVVVVVLVDVVVLLDVGVLVEVVVEARVVEVVVEARVVDVVVEARVVDVVVGTVLVVVDAMLVVVVEARVVVVVQSSGLHASAQLVKAPHTLLGGNCSSHFASFTTWHVTWPLLPFTLRQSTKLGLPQIDAFRAEATSRSHAFGKPFFPSSSRRALRMGRQQILYFLAEVAASHGHNASTSSNARSITS